MTKSISFRGLFAWFGLACLLAVVGGNANAAWWEFGAHDDQPVIDELKFNTVDVSNAESDVVLAKDDLDNQRIVMRGRASVRDGQIGLVELSLDGGETWAPVELGERGSFTHDFVPEFNRPYEFRIRALTTTGKSTDIEDHSFTLEVVPVINTEEVVSAFRAMLDAYMTENRGEFMRRVANDFEGDRSALEDAVDDDFRWLDGIRIDINVSRVMRYDNTFQVYFTFRRRAMSVATGQSFQDSSASTVSFTREEGDYRLSRIAAPPIFGVSNPGEVATSITEQAVGQNVLTLNPDTGAATTSPQGDSVGSGFSSIESGTITLNFFAMNNTQGFTFDGATIDTETDMGNLQGDIAYFGGELTLQNGVLVQPLGGSIATITKAPTTGYLNQPAIFNAMPGQSFALQLLGPKYVLLEIVSVNVGTALTFRYKYQPDGSPNF